MSGIRESIEELTTQILVDNDMLYKVPVDVIGIAKNYGITVYAAELDNGTSGAIKYDDKTKKFEIIVNRKNNFARQRFTIAHELGHYFLHREMLESSDIHVDTLYRAASTVDEGIETKEKEKEVDYFAGALLMNKMVVEKLIKKYGIDELAEIFNVSYSAMTVRLSILGLF